MRCFVPFEMGSEAFGWLSGARVISTTIRKYMLLVPPPPPTPRGFYNDQLITLINVLFFSERRHRGRHNCPICSNNVKSPDFVLLPLASSCYEWFFFWS